MDAEKKLLLLHLKSDLKEVLKLTRDKSEELLNAFKNDSDKVSEKAEDLEYYISSMLDLTKEIKALFDKKVSEFKLNPKKFDINESEFDEMLKRLAGLNDTNSLREILDILESWEHYELCALVSEKIKLTESKAIS